MALPPATTDTLAPPDPRSVEGDLHKALAVLAHAKMDGSRWLTPAEISRRLMDHYGIRVHWRTVDAELSRDNTLAARRKRGGQRQYAIMTAGENLLGAASSIIVVEPERAVQGVASLHGFLGDLRGTARICDPYLDAVTIEHLDAAKQAAEIRLLTKKVDDTGTLRRLVAATKTQGRNLQIRVAAAPLHDRYIIDDKEMVILGTSLNGFGKKQCFIIKAGQDMRTIMKAAFDGIWSTATPWP